MNPGGRRETSPTAPAGIIDALSDAFATEAAFDAWYAQVLPRVYGFVYSRCGRDPELAEELTQETFVDAIRHRRRYAGQADPVTWLCAIARHRLADHYRRLDRQERRQARLVREIDLQGADDLDRLDQRERIAQAVRRLPALQRAVLVLTALDGLTVREAAALIGKSEHATESLLVRARAGFRAAYGEDRGRGHG